MDDVDENFIMDNVPHLLDLGDEEMMELMRRRARLPKRYVRDAANPVEWFREGQFRNRYRFSKDAVMNVILPLVIDQLERANNRGLPVPPILQLTMALRYYGTGSIQTVVGDLRSFSQPTVSLCIRRVSIALARLMTQYVRFPSTEREQLWNIQQFYNMAGMPGVAADIDGCLIPIGSPGRLIAELFRCRKGFFAINLLAAVDPRGSFTYMDTRYVGPTHDQTGLDRSALRIIFEDGLVIGNLLGDNGYASGRFVLVPFERPLNVFERRYNAAHIPTRNFIERIFGRWKKKFHCLKSVMLTRLDNTIATICACAVLWNIHIDLTNPRVIPEDFVIQNEALLERADPRMSGLEYRLHVLMTRFM